MPRLATARSRQSVALALLAGLTLSCQPKTSTDAEGPAEETTPFVAAAPAAGPALVFPPPPTATDRGPSPEELREDVAKVDDRGVAWPRLDEDGEFSVWGKSIEFGFHAVVSEPKDLASLVTLTPTVTGKTVWTGSELVFVSKDHFDPDQTYEIELGALTTSDGKTVGEGWKGKFTATPQVSIAGKLIDYLPDPGKKRVVALDKWDDQKVGRRIAVDILFDQPVEIADVEARIGISYDGKDVDVGLSRPRKDMFDGVKIAEEHVVRVRPKKWPRPGTEVHFEVEGADSDDYDKDIDLEVAEPLKFETVRCRYGWDEDPDCELKRGKLRLSDRMFTIRFNNRIKGNDKKLRSLVTVDPPIKGLTVTSDRYSSEGWVRVSGDFSSSKTYHVTVAPLQDVYGYKIEDPIEFDIVRPPQPTSVAMAGGVQFMDAKTSRAFTITTRNVKKAKLELWAVESTPDAWRDAQRSLSEQSRPSGSPEVTIELSPKRKRDVSVETKVDLLAKTESGKSYLAMLSVDSAAFGAGAPKVPSWSMAALPPTALVTPHDDGAIVLHGHASVDQTLVHVAKLSDGEPVSGATVRTDDGKKAITGKDGLAVLTGGLDPGQTRLLRAELGDESATLALGTGSLSTGSLAPELSGGREVAGDIRAIVMTDRGAYRPGASVKIKTSLRRPSAGGLRPVAEETVRIRVVGPTGKEAMATEGRLGDMGGFATEFAVPAGAEIGRWQIFAEHGSEHAQVAQTTIQVAEFEPPRFTVDVETTAPGKDRVVASVLGKYLFGAAMDDADVAWTLRRSDAPLPQGSLVRRGLRFRPERSWSEEEPAPWVRTGEGKLDGAGTLEVSQTVEIPDGRGPQRFELEATVTDASYRQIASRHAVVLDSAPHYAGIKLDESWLEAAGPLEFEAGVVDKEGNAVAGRSVEVVLERLKWVRSKTSGPGGSRYVRWHEKASRVGACKTKSATTVVTCDLSASTWGTYRLTAYVDGNPGGSARLWIWGGDEEGPPVRGRALPVSVDSPVYKPGGKAKVAVQSPFAKATALLTIDSGGLLRHEVKEVKGRRVSFDVDIPRDWDAPWMHATVTLLPRDATGQDAADFKFGAVRLPVELTDVRLDVTAKAEREAYAPGEQVTIDLEVLRGGKPVGDAEVVLAVVDEGVLRLTNHHAPDPVPAMHPGRPLRLTIDDNRRELAEMLARSHSGGDGSGSGAQSLVGARKRFVRTALWKPDVRTGPDGKAQVTFTLPDNLTRFRIMAVALDTEGRGGKVEDGFLVRKPIMAQTVVPRFATIGDQFEAAVMVHNNTESDETLTVAMGSESKKVVVPAGSRARAAFPIAPRTPGNEVLVFSVTDSEGTQRDKVVATIPVSAPGVAERPRLAGAFVGGQRIKLEVPEGVLAGRQGDEFVTVILGENLYPELGQRLAFLIDYPHGCVEQTTSSTVPLLAAREVLPRLGVTQFSAAQLDDMIKSGVDRLAKMRTSSGGLAYWPGGHEPNVFGTAYAMNAVVGAKRAGIEIPPGMLEGMREFLEGRLLADHLGYGNGPEVRAMVALALAESGGMPAAAADMLFDTKDAQGTFGRAAMAMALSSLEGQDERVQELLGEVETAFDEQGVVVASGNDDFYYYGSHTRSRAAALMALGRMRPESVKLPAIAQRLIGETDSYTTQSTAWSLLSLGEHIARKGDGDSQGRLRAMLDGAALVPTDDSDALGGGALRYQIPLASLRGTEAMLELQAEAEAAIMFSVSGRWKRPVADAGSLAAKTGTKAPDIWRVITLPDGEPTDLAEVAPGQMLRVVLLAQLPNDRLDRSRLGYLALSDRIPAGFEAMQPDLWTVASVPELSSAHPLYDVMSWGPDASHVELRDDRANFYFDRVWGDYVHATYLVRATTPGRFTAAPATAELMYESDGVGWSQGLTVEVKE